MDPAGDEGTVVLSKASTPWGPAPLLMFISASAERDPYSHCHRSESTNLGHALAEVTALRFK